ncbi:amino acid carrier protein [Puniceicoccus vermicola]|uniref:Sodium:alanine symporter family protein n=1 Tax=Puniceicoccus vermicola TaxID=388746 RepID=A0A7X1E6R9_9BACT|nr:sodium:alanine symporter family protein [Puniceicoccus vermicola]
MESIEAGVSWVNGWLWGSVLLILLVGVGITLMVGLRFIPVRKLPIGFRQLFGKRKEEGDGDILPFNALMTSLSGTIGTGNIVGVASAIAIGGPGALFWMWCTAVVGLATKYSEAVLAVHFREKDSLGQHVGGPMYYIQNGLGKKFVWMAVCFSIFGALAGFGIGNTVQVSSIAHGLEVSLGMPRLLTGLVVAVLVGAVILGGIKRIGSVAGKIVPVMSVAYIGLCGVVIVMNLSSLPSVLIEILESAFSPVAATGGFAGSTIMIAVRMGVSRGVFSNEAGLGSAPIAHASAQTNSPVRQGTLAMLGTFIDTLVICTMTGVAIVLSGVWTQDVQGMELSILAMNTLLPASGNLIVVSGMVIFAFTTVLGWALYGERCAEYLFGVKIILPYRILWVLAVPVGAVMDLRFIWNCADMLNGLMALPNLVALLLLSRVVFSLTRDYFSQDE